MSHRETLFQRLFVFSSESEVMTSSHRSNGWCGWESLADFDKANLNSSALRLSVGIPGGIETRDRAADSAGFVNITRMVLLLDGAPVERRVA